MTVDANHILNLLESVSEGNKNVYNDSIALTQLLDNPKSIKILLYITVNQSNKFTTRLAAAIQLKNLIDTKWARGPYFSDDDKAVVRREVVACLFDLQSHCSTFYMILTDIIAKISRSDWNTKWPELFDILYEHDQWIVIYKVCKIQSSRRISNGIILFRQLAASFSVEIYNIWSTFRKINPHVSEDFNDKLILNCTFQLKTLCLFIRYTHLIINKDEQFCSLIGNIAFEIVDYLLMYFDFYFSTILQMCHSLCDKLERFLKSTLYILIHYEQKSPESFNLHSSKFQHFFISLFNSKSKLVKSNKLTLLLLNLLKNYLKSNDKLPDDSSLLHLEFMDFFRSLFLIEDINKLEEIENDPELCLEQIPQKEESVVDYDCDRVIDEVLEQLIKKSSLNNLDQMFHMIETSINHMINMTPQYIDSLMNFLSIAIKSIKYTNSSLEKPFSVILNGQLIVEKTLSVLNYLTTNKCISQTWRNSILRRCSNLLSKWIIEDKNICEVQTDRIFAASHLCFNVLLSSNFTINESNFSVVLSVVIFIGKIIDEIVVMRPDLIDNANMHEMFFNPSIHIIIKVLSTVKNSNSHTRLVIILINLLQASRIWSDLELVKTVANLIYNLWCENKLPSNETVILREQLLDCFDVIVGKSDIKVIQSALSTLSYFVKDSFHMLVNNSPSNKNRSLPAIDCTVLLGSTLNLWSKITSKSEVFLDDFDLIYSIISHSFDIFKNLNPQNIETLLEIIQNHFVLKVMSQMNKQDFIQLTMSTWEFISSLPWSPADSENICSMRIQLYNLWILGFHYLYKESPVCLFEIGAFARFLIDRIKELFINTSTDPSRGDKYYSLSHNCLILLAHLCLIDKNCLSSIMYHLATSETEYNNLTISLLDRWMLRLDNQSCYLIQQMFVVTIIQWMTSVIGVCLNDESEIYNRIKLLIHSCVQACSIISQNHPSEKVEASIRLEVPSHRYLALAYIYWNPLTNYYTHISQLISSLIHQLTTNNIGKDRFDHILNIEDNGSKSRFCQLFGWKIDSHNISISYASNAPITAESSSTFSKLLQ